MYKTLMLTVIMFALLTILVACGGEQTADRALQAPPEQAVKNGLSDSTAKPAEASNQALPTQVNSSPASEPPETKQPAPVLEPVQEQKQEPALPAQQDQKQASASGQTAPPEQETQMAQPKPPKVEQPSPVQPKPEQPKTEQPKAEQPEPQQLKTEQPKAVEPKPAAPPPDTVKAEALFKDNCMACHGESLKGGFGPNLQQVGASKSKDQIMKQILNGSGDMPGFAGQLDQKSIDTLAVWLSEKK
ncbi:c-type cytochrome [Paenibacillus silviterrae]|uniref:c-type cytochrome n=1 Tax=Paenibacillus silviterrae TaxID=3242194 RepID=UPI0025428F7A|nr:c-type cytochrome [Paenibacillus chinjuensis]